MAAIMLALTFNSFADSREPPLQPTLDYTLTPFNSFADSRIRALLPKRSRAIDLSIPLRIREIENIIKTRETDFIFQFLCGFEMIDLIQLLHLNRLAFNSFADSSFLSAISILVDNSPFNSFADSSTQGRAPGGARVSPFQFLCGFEVRTIKEAAVLRAELFQFLCGFE